jgi:thiosulfate reductase cytochrome b subunit
LLTKPLKPVFLFLMSDSEKIVLIEEKHPAVIRWTHWINFPLLTIMVWSGGMIYWANRTYWPPLPEKLFSILNIHHRLAEGLSYHFFIMWLFTLNGLLYVIYSLVSGEWREIFPTRKSFGEAVTVLKHDLGFKNIVLPSGKFNGAQRIVYTSVIFMGFGFILSGLAIYKPIQLSWLKNFLGGYEVARRIHFYLTLFIVLFFFVHVGQVVKSGWNNFRAMVAGYEIKKQGKGESHHG